LGRLYANENFPFPVVEELRRLGHDVLTVAETGRSNQQMSDTEVLEFAIRDDRAVLTHNRRHFFALHRQRPTHAGIIACTYDADFSALAGRIQDAISGTEVLDGQLIRIIRPAR
jgi:predicted nuclease of predicted toxin-antitoxin system